jgi:uncharacterized protein (TIGR03086 family)
MTARSELGTVPRMGKIADRYRKNAAAFTARVEAVPSDRWGAPTPCEEWTARDIVNHVVNASGLFLGFVGRELPPGPSAEDDPRAAWTSARDTIIAGLDDPAIAKAEYDGFTGKATFEEGVDRFLSADLVVHGWDLARATGLDEHMDPDEVHVLRNGLGQMPEKMLRSPGAFGPAVDAPADADEQTKLLAFLGRRA